MAASSTPARHPEWCRDASRPGSSSLPALTYERHRGTAGAALPSGYRRREPEKSVLHGIVRDHLEGFLEQAGLPDGEGYPRFVERAPDGPGAPGPVIGWGGSAFSDGSYTIALSGTDFCESPTATEQTTWGQLKGLYR